LQPIRRFDFNAAILFSDIQMVPLALRRKMDAYARHMRTRSDCLIEEVLQASSPAQLRRPPEQKTAEKNAAPPPTMNSSTCSV
jgi:hypothetical protein